jgi:1-acyl-sn-glycerol-3-phosphate acyltransferase
MQRKTLQAIIYKLFTTLSTVRAIGLENVPRQGGAILATNHMSRIDAGLVFALLERQDISGLVADKYKKNPVFRLLIDVVNGIYINRESSDFQALRAARNYLSEGHILGIAPEGTRARTGVLIPAKTGVAYLADKANVPVIPLAIYGTENAMAKVFRLQRPKITIHFSQPILFPPIARSNRDSAMQRNTDEIMCQIAAMLPAKYHGAYANHPRLQEILASQPGATMPAA